MNILVLLILLAIKRYGTGSGLCPVVEVYARGQRESGLVFTPTGIMADCLPSKELQSVLQSRLMTS